MTLSFALNYADEVEKEYYENEKVKGLVLINKEVILNIVSMKLGKELENSDAKRTLNNLGVDELDFVEILLEIENIVTLNNNCYSIYDENITLNEFTNIIQLSIIDIKKLQKIPNNKSDTLTLNEVGIYKNLILKKNPKKLKLLFVPELKQLYRTLEEQKNRKLNKEEKQTIKENAIVIALD